MDVIVIGAGIAGLSTAWWLAQRTGVNVRVLERFELGHERGSSHGTSRISRTTYVDAQYVRMMRHALEHCWPRLEADAGVQLHFPVEGCFFGPRDGLIQRYAQAVAQADPRVQALSPTQARARFAAMHFEDDDLVLADPSASVVAADHTLRALARQIQRHGGHIQEHAQVTAITPAPNAVHITLADGTTLHADKVVVTAGAWSARLVPALNPILCVKRQTVGYFKLRDPAAGRIDRFPVWIHLGHDFNDVHYGLPEFGQPGVKAAHHATAGQPDDPDAAPDDPIEALERLRRFVRWRFAVDVIGEHRVERCLYTNTPDEGVIWAPSPRDPRIIIGTGHSGHGFKLGPLAGQVLADLAVDGHTQAPTPPVDWLSDPPPQNP